jgi:MbtH protein
MGNPFEDPAAEYLVLINDQNQYSLWPSFKAPPRGWRIARGRGSRESSLSYVTAQWIDMRPRTSVFTKVSRRQSQERVTADSGSR